MNCSIADMKTATEETIQEPKQAINVRTIILLISIASIGKILLRWGWVGREDGVGQCRI